MKSEKRIIQILLRSRLFRDFSATELLEKLPELDAELRLVERGDTLIETDEEARRIGQVVSGRVMFCRCGASGCVHELGYRGADDIFGLTALFSGPGRSPVTVRAAADGEVLLFDIRTLLEDERCRDRIKDAAMLMLANHSVKNILRLDVLQAKTMREQIMTFFQTMRDKHESDQFQIKPNQAELAEYLGVNRSALSRELNKMQREGILEILPNRRYHILEWNTGAPEQRQTSEYTSSEGIQKNELR